MSLLGSLFKSVAREQAPGDQSVTVVTSMHPSGYEEYGRKFIETFEQHWPQSHRLRLYAEGFSLEPSSPRVTVLDLLQEVPDVLEFRNRHGTSPSARGRMPNGAYTYRLDAVKFANKSFATAHAAGTCGTRYLVWLDADTVTRKAVPESLVASLLPKGCFVAYFGRQFTHSETGFIAFDLAQANAEEFFDTVRRIYLSGEIFQLREWHDCEVFDVTRAVLAAQGKIASHSLSPPGTAHPIVNSELGEYLDHLKGPERKKTGASKTTDFQYYRGQRLPPAPKNLNAGRYAFVQPLIDLVKPRTIAEIGTWSGHRALQMAAAALRHSQEVKYFGFDLFESASPEDDAREKNVKHHFTFDEVSALLDKFAEENPGFDYTLTPGDTRTSLPQMSVDLAFIDGGHSIETIRSDFERLRNSRVVLLDDYYEGPIDTKQFGCNRVIEGLPHLVLPSGDPVAGGGLTYFAVVAHPALLDELRGALLPAAPAGTET